LIFARGAVTAIPDREERDRKFWSFRRGSAMVDARLSAEKS